MKLRILIFIYVFFISTISLWAQEKDKNEKEKPKREKVYFGGSFGLQFGTITNIELSPLVGYRLTERFSAGVGGTVNYYKYQDIYSDYSSFMYGGSVFSRFLLHKNIFAHGQLEMINYKWYEIASDDYKRLWDLGVLIGGGYREPIGKRASTYIMLLYNLNQTSTSPYSNPILRIGITF